MNPNCGVARGVGMAQPNFTSDLVEEIKGLFHKLGIRYGPDPGDPSRLAAQYFYVRFRMISAKPRLVHISKTLESRLLTMDSNWTTLVNVIKDHFQAGGRVSKFLSKRIFDATFNDGLLNDYRIHHFHLSDKLDKGGFFVKRSDMLLFALVEESDAFFIDVVPHPDDRTAVDFGWTRQDLLTTINSNWPQLLEPHIAGGISGDILTDAQKKVLRQKNINVVHQVGDEAIFPMGGGVTSAGTNMLWQVLGDKLIYEIENLQRYCETQPSDIRTALKNQGHDLTEDMEFKLVLFDEFDASDGRGQSIQGNLKGSGWGIVEVTTGTVVDLRLTVEGG